MALNRAPWESSTITGRIVFWIAFVFMALSLLMEATFSAKAEVYSVCGAAGGVGGVQFLDRGIAQTNNRRLIEVRVRAGAYIDAIQLVYQDAAGQIFTSDRHGGPGGTLNVLKLGRDEYITRIDGKHGNYIDSLHIVTNKRDVGWGGPGGSVHYVFNAPPGSIIHGFGGRSGKYLDAISVIFKTP